jgi:hypothetical protein
MDSVDVRRVRTHVAWLLLLAAAVLVAVAAWQFVGLPGRQSGFGFTFVSSSGSTASSSSLSVVGSGLGFAARGLTAVGSLASIDVTLLPVAAVVLAAVGRPVRLARQVALAAAIIQAVALVLAIVAWAAALTLSDPAWFPVTTAAELVVAVACLILTVTVLRSPALRGPAGPGQPPTPADSPG